MMVQLSPNIWDTVKALSEENERLRAELRAAVDALRQIAAEKASEDAKKNIFWDIILLQVKGEVEQFPYGMGSKLVIK